MHISLQLMASDSYTSHENDRSRNTYEQSHESSYQDQNIPQEDLKHNQQSTDFQMAPSVSAGIKALTILFIQILSPVVGIGSGAFIGAKLLLNDYPASLSISATILLPLVIPIGTQYCIVTYWE